MNTNKKNQATEKKHRITFIDIIALVVVLCLVVVAAFNISSNFLEWQAQTEVISSKKTLLYVVAFEALTKEQTEQIQVNDEVYFLIDGDKGNLSGKVVEIEIQMHSKWIPYYDRAEIVLLENSNLNDVWVTIELNCTYNSGSGYFFDGNQLLVGEKNELQFPAITKSGECVAMTVKE